MDPGASVPRSPRTEAPVGDAKIVVCLGLPRSGSTWLYNVARELLGRRYPEGPIACGFSDDFTAPQSTGARPVRCFLIKAHNPTAHFRALLGSTSARLLISIRDPRDAVASLMQSFRLTFHDAAGAVYSSAKTLAEMARCRHDLLLRYEDGFTDDIAAVQRIGEALGCTDEAPILRRIHHELSRAGVSEKIRELGRRGAFRPEPAFTTWDPQTQWHPAHLGDGRVGKFAECLTIAEIRRLERHFGSFMTQFSYGCTEG
jgi:sulfotransferase family protein